MNGIIIISSTEHVVESTFHIKHYKIFKSYCSKYNIRYRRQKSLVVREFEDVSNFLFMFK